MSNFLIFFFFGGGRGRVGSFGEVLLFFSWSSVVCSENICLLFKNTCLFVDNCHPIKRAGVVDSACKELLGDHLRSRPARPTLDLDSVPVFLV